MSSGIRPWPSAAPSISDLMFACVLVVAATFQIATAASEPLLFDVAQAEAAYDQRNGEPLVSFRFTPASGQKFAEFTAQNVGRMTELRVDGKVLSRIAIREQITGGSGQISGHFSVQEAKDLAARLSAGAQIEIEIVAN
jgi:preprotein translocase subunit SecD